MASASSSSLPPALPGRVELIDSRAGRLAVYAGGPASGAVPVLLVHSVNAAASAAEVRPLYEDLSSRGPVAAPDLPGFGLSDRSERPYTIRLMTDAVLEAAAWLGGPVDAVAVSLGCEFLARAAVERPSAFRRLAFVSPTGLSGGAARRGAAGAPVGPGWALPLVRGPGWGTALFRGLTRPGVIRHFLRRTWGSDAIDEALWRYDVATTRVPGAERAPLAFVSAQLFAADALSLYEAVAAPVWVAHGTRGDFTDYRRLPDLLAARPAWRRTVFEAGALPHFEHPAEFAAELRRHFG